MKLLQSQRALLDILFELDSWGGNDSKLGRTIENYFKKMKWMAPNGAWELNWGGYACIDYAEQMGWT